MDALSSATLLSQNRVSAVPIRYRLIHISEYSLPFESPLKCNSTALPIFPVSFAYFLSDYLILFF